MEDKIKIYVIPTSQSFKLDGTEKTAERLASDTYSLSDILAYLNVDGRRALDINKHVFICYIDGKLVNIDSDSFEKVQI